MTKYSNFNNEQKNKLYTNVLLLCRNKLFYTNFNLNYLKKLLSCAFSGTIIHIIFHIWMS